MNQTIQIGSPDHNAEFHKQRATSHRHDEQLAQALAGKVGLLRLITVVFLLVFGVAAFRQASLIYPTTTAALLLVFITFGVWLAKLQRKASQRNSAAQFHEYLLARIESAETQQSIPAPPTIPANVQYASDLDLFGANSLFARISTAHTPQGSATLARWLSATAKTTEIIRDRQQAIQELAATPSFRERLWTQGAVISATSPQQTELANRKGQAKESLYQVATFDLPPLFAKLAPVMPIITWMCFASGYAGLVPRQTWLAPLALQFLVWALTSRRSLDFIQQMESRSDGLFAYAVMIETCETELLESARAKQLQQDLKRDAKGASKQLRTLGRRLGWAELYMQPLVHIFVNPLLLWDLNAAILLSRWLKTFGAPSKRWLDVIGEFEALASLASWCTTEAPVCFPTVDAQSGELRATKLGHPLLSRNERVANELALDGPGHLTIVTGSNMAGKSTWLRAVGCNVALALAGGAVCAETMKLPFVRLRTSMRIQDSLQQGSSYFHAELSKLKSILSNIEKEPPVLFLLDEVLRGTNPEARRTGVYALVQHLLSNNAMGLVATHDLALTKLGEQKPDQVQNSHFTDTLIGDELHFDYQLREGIVPASNALFLLRKAGLPEIQVDARPTGS